MQQFTNWLTGAKLDSPGTIAATSASEYAVTVRSQETTAGLALAVQYGASATSTTTIALFNKTGVSFGVPLTLNSSVTFNSGVSFSSTSATTPTVTAVNNNTAAGTALSISNGTQALFSVVNSGTNAGYVSVNAIRWTGNQWYDVLAYGAKGNSSTDDTAAIQAAVDAAKLTGGIVYFPPRGTATYLCGALDLNNIGTGSTTWGVILMGAGWQSTRLSIASGQSATNWFECIGALALQIRDMQIGTTTSGSTTADAECGVLLAAASGATVAAAANAIHLGPGLRITGRFSKAALYVYGVPSSDYFDVDLYNYYRGASRGVWLTATNDGSAAAHFTSAAIGTGTQGISDIAMRSVEIHELSRYNDATTASSAIGLSLEGVTNFKFSAGNISGNNASQYVELKNYASTGNISFDNVTFYREGTSGTISSNVFKIVTGTSHHVRGLDLQNLNIQASSGIVGGVATAAYTGLVLGPWAIGGGATASYVCSFDGTGGTLIDCDLWCNGFNVAANVITGASILRNPVFVAPKPTTDTSTKILSNAIAIGNVTSTSPTGFVRLPSQQYITSDNTPGTGTLQMLGSTNSDRIQVGQSAAVVGVILDGTTDQNFLIGGTTKAKVVSGGFQANRLVSAGFATAHTVANFGSLTGWGTGATCSAVSGHEWAGRFQITAGTSGTLANPTLVYTYPAGAYGTAPEVILSFVGGTGAGTAHQANVTKGVSSVTFQMFFTPVTNATYIYAYIVAG